MPPSLRRALFITDRALRVPIQVFGQLLIKICANGVTLGNLGLC
jgi:hypothetical protein